MSLVIGEDGRIAQLIPAGSRGVFTGASQSLAIGLGRDVL